MNLAHTIAHFLFPRQSNNHRGKILHNSTIIAITVLFIAYQVLIQYIGSAYPQILGYAANISVDQVVSLTNQKRAEQGLPALTINPTLSQAAYAKGAHMLENDYWAHVAPDGTEPWNFFHNFGYKYRYAGENLARDFSNASSAVDAWMASPTHRDNILSSNYSEIGIGVIEGDLAGKDTTLIVQFFGKKMVDTPAEVVPVAQAQGQSIAPTAVPTVQPTARPTGNLSPTVAATSVPSVVPSPLDTPPVEQENVEVTIAQAIPTDPPVAQKTLVSPFTVTRGVSIGLVSILLVALVVDIVVISRKKIARVGGRNIAHLAFFGMVLAILLIARAGEIL